MNLRRMAAFLTKDTVVIFLVCLFAGLFGVGHEEVTQFDVRFVVFAQDMFRHGIHVFPTIFDQPYPDYISLPIVLIYLCSLPFGKVIHFSAVLPTAVASSLMMVHVYKIASMHSKEWGKLAVAMAFMTCVFLESSRTIVLDVYPALIAVVAYYYLLSNELQQQKQRHLVMMLFMLLGFVFRGPIGLIMPCAVMAVFFSVRHQWRRLLTFLFLSFALSVLLFFCLSLCAFHTGGNDFMQKVLSMEVGSRIVRSTVSYLAYLDVFLNEYLISSVIALLSVLFCAKKIFKKSEQIDSVILNDMFWWMLVIVVGMTIPGEKKPRYIFSIMPPVTLLSSYFFYVVDVGRFMRLVRRMMVALLSVLPIALVSLLIYAHFYYLPARHLEMPKHIYMVVFLLLALQCVNVSKLRSNAFLSTVIISSAMSFWAVYAFIYEPINLEHHQSQIFVNVVEGHIQQQPGKLYFYKIQKDGDDIKYFVNAEREVGVKYIKQQERLLHTPRAAYVVMPLVEYRSLPNEVLCRYVIFAMGRFAGEEMVAMRVPINRHNVVR